MIHFGEDLEKLIKCLFETIRCVQATKEYKENLSLSCGETRILIDTNVIDKSAFITIENSIGDVVITISEVSSVYKVLFLFRDVLPNGAFINKDELQIVYSFIECVKSCEDTKKQIFYKLSSKDFIAGKILMKHSTLDKFRVIQLLKVNRIDLCCLANLHLLQSKTRDPPASSSKNVKIPKKSSTPKKKATNTNNAKNNLILESVANINPSTVSSLNSVNNTESNITLNNVITNSSKSVIPKTAILLYSQPHEMPYSIVLQQSFPIMQQPTLQFEQQQQPVSYSQIESLTEVPELMLAECNQEKIN